MKRYSPIKHFIMTFLLVLVVQAGIAEKKGYSGLFGSDSVLELTLETDLTLLKSDRDKEEGYISGTIQYKEGEKVELPVKVRVRGKYRLQESTCTFPPLKLKFSKSDSRKSIFKDNREIKLVTHCNSDSGMLYSVIREYLAYRIYNVLSEASLKVRLVKISYVDSGNGDSLVQYGFVIEDVGDMCERLSVEEQKFMNVKLDQLDKDEMLKMTMFQYMIGNEDWSVPKYHNVVLVQDGRHSPFVAVPYDFDMSSFVNPPYLSRIKGPNDYEQSFKGDKVDLDDLQGAVDEYLEKREEILQLIIDMPKLPVNCRQKCLLQIEDFFAKLDTKNSLKRNFIVKR